LDREKRPQRPIKNEANVAAQRKRSKRTWRRRIVVAVVCKKESFKMSKPPRVIKRVAQKDEKLLPELEGGGKVKKGRDGMYPVRKGRRS